MSLRWTFPIPLPPYRTAFLALKKKQISTPAIFTRVHKIASKCMQIANFKADKANRAFAIKSWRESRDETLRESLKFSEKENCISRIIK